MPGMPWCAAFIVAAVIVLGGLPAAAETFRLVGPDGTVHFTNTPTDPRYHRMGIARSGTAAGWFRVPDGSLTPYLAEIRFAAERYDLPEALLSAVIRVESGFNPRAVSPKGARGLMQLMPETATMLGVRNAFDPRQNIDGGARHLRALLERFGFDVPLALAAYNAGEQAVLVYRGIPPYPETQEYVARVLQLVNGPGAAPLPRRTYRRLEADGTVVYTNIPPRGRL